MPRHAKINDSYPISAINAVQQADDAKDKSSILEVITDITEIPVAKPSKISQVLTLLQSPEGATLNQLVEATGWLPHTTRAALTGLRKKGYLITRSTQGDASLYRIMEGV